MTKLKINEDVQSETGYSFVECALKGADTGCIPPGAGFDVDNGKLSFYVSEGLSYEATPAKPKHLRKFARALLALADQVDPPAPVIEYFHVDDTSLYYRFTDGRAEYWDIGSRWTASSVVEDVAGLFAYWEGEVAAITAEKLPQAARPA